MIFRRKIQKSCSYCTYGTKIAEDTVLCMKRGFMPIYKHCRKFEYDPRPHGRTSPEKVIDKQKKNYG